MNRYLKISGIIGGVLLLLYLGASLIAPGSYANAKIYTLPISEENLLQIIQEVKNENPEFRPKNNTNPTKHKYWTFVTFYYEDTDEFVNTWTRNSYGENKSQFAFVSLCPTTDIYAGKEINRDYSWLESRKEISKFEKLILDKIEAKIK
jgi:hypothetical protein